MRTKIAIIILVLGGIAFTSNLLTGNRAMGGLELAKVKTVCLECHPSVPTYEAATRVHNKHAALSCSHCHSDNSGLTWVERLRLGLKWLGIGTLFLALSGIIASALITNGKSQGG